MKITYLSHVCLKVPEILCSMDSKGELEVLSVKTLCGPRLDTGKIKPERVVCMNIGIRPVFSWF